MAPRTNYSDGQEIINQDLNADTARLELELYERVIYQLLQSTDNAFFGASLGINFVGSTSLSASPGLGFQTDNTQVDPEPKKRPIWLASPASITLSSPDASHDRIDLICVQNQRVNAVTQARNYKDPISSVISSVNFVTETDWGANIQVVAGTPSITPVAPAAPAGFLVLAQVLVHAVTGVGSQADITDMRSLMPVGSSTPINTLAFNRAPQSANESLQVVLAAFDAYLTAGLQTYTDLVDQGVDPAVPASGNYRIYSKSGVLYAKSHAGVVTPIGSGGGGGGGGANWNANDGIAPLEDDSEMGEKVWNFAKGAGQKLTLIVKVPQGYLVGRQILMYLGQYTPTADSTSTQLLQTTTSLVRQGVDSIKSTANQRISTNSPIVCTAVPFQYQQATLDLTDSSGHVNGFAVSPGDILRVDLVRGTDTDTADLRFIPSSTEVKLS
jgi:hypothetical protein